MVTRLRGQLNDKKSSAFEELDEILNKKRSKFNILIVPNFIIDTCKK